MKAGAMDRCKNNRRVDVQRCPAVPIEPKNTAGSASSRSASERTMDAGGGWVS